MMQPFDFKYCTAQILANTLIQQRGKDVAVHILQQATKLAATQPEQEQQREEATKTTSNADDSNNLKLCLGNHVLSQPLETSFLSPRLGKFLVQLHDHGIVATKTNDPMVEFVVLDTNVSHILMFPKPEDCKILFSTNSNNTKKKITGGNLILLQLSTSMTVTNSNNKKSTTDQLCFNLPFDRKLGPIGPSLLSSATTRDNKYDDDNDPTDDWRNILEHALGRHGAAMAQVQPNATSVFQSFQPPDQSTTTGGMPFINCYHGVNDGVLYPLREGLLFYKPPKFLPRCQLHSIACGRGSGGSGPSSSRYVDMIVQLTSSSPSSSRENENKEIIEFTNIQREENVVLNGYIHNVLIPAMQEDATERKNNSDNMNNTNNRKKDEDEDVEAVVAGAMEDGDDETEDDENAMDIQEAEDDDEDSDVDDEDFEEDEEYDDDEDDKIFGDGDDEDDGFTQVRDDFANDLAKRKKAQNNNDDESATESEEDEDGNDLRPRVSKRLRQQGGTIIAKNNTKNEK